MSVCIVSVVAALVLSRMPWSLSAAKGFPMHFPPEADGNDG
ncbi:MAG TPA: hypothetical protein VLH56_08230 [Dissulfurispiraceae bacterium]|nr:hypothetical protein [Dissulfurispiraceae bacterium]